MAYGVRLRVTGRWALFTRPEMKVERVSYDVMTPSAARGILEAIHWKPAIRWVVDEIHVLKPIRFQSIRRNEVGAKAPVASIRKAMKSGDIGELALIVEDNRQQRAATLLSDVDYLICAHFEMTPKKGPDDNEAKHLDTFNRRARKGQSFHQPCLGAREFPAAFELIEPDAPLPQAKADHRTAALGFGTPRELGFMLYDIDHSGDRGSILFRATLVDGVMKVPPPGSPELRR
ncbi:type I-C CRISPR-associated protein Cas5c [Rhodopseudomonas sp.]|uniref:type I-C CRISPR-associated protein Cas5c n=1 Tax=Rhodopseudomonas sp. TaxID=1078 RepID=UPI0039E34EA8